MVIKRSTMTLYSDPLDIPSHRVRIILAEKNISVDVRYTSTSNPSEDLLTLNPYNTLPTLIDRDLTLYETGVITEYLDERFPHPPLLPVYPIARANCRQMIYRIEHDWLSLVDVIQKNGKDADKARESLINQLTTLAPVFAELPFFLSEEFSLADCCLAAMLWRLPSLGVDVSKIKAIKDYEKRIFARDSFKASLSEAEKELHDPV